MCFSRTSACVSHGMLMIVLLPNPRKLLLIWGGLRGILFFLPWLLFYFQRFLFSKRVCRVEKLVWKFKRSCECVSYVSACVWVCVCKGCCEITSCVKLCELRMGKKVGKNTEKRSWKRWANIHARSCEWKSGKMVWDAGFSLLGISLLLHFNTWVCAHAEFLIINVINKNVTWNVTVSFDGNGWVEYKSAAHEMYEKRTRTGEPKCLHPHKLLTSTLSAWLF